MTMNNNFLAAMVAAGTVYQREITKPQVQIYADLLLPRDLDQCAVAVKSLLCRNRYFPLPVDIINELEGSVTDKAVIAWNDINEHLSDGDKPTFDPIAEKIIKQMGGWHVLSRATYYQLDFKRKDFLQRYETALRYSTSIYGNYGNMLEYDGQPLILEKKSA